MKKKLVRSTSEHFRQIFHEKPEYVFLSPGRINIIGEHVDYNDGYVLPAAINKYICFAISRNNSSSCVLHACDMHGYIPVQLTNPLSRSTNPG
ncbi:MAG: galactokinase family protein [Ferruginibacter sp.]